MILASAELAAVLAALTVMSLALAGIVPSIQRRRELASRLSAAVATGIMANDQGGRRRSRSIVRPRRASARGALGWMQRRLDRAGLEVAPGEVFGAMALAATAGLLLGGLTQGAVGALAAGTGGTLLPLAWVARRGASRQSKFRKQLADTVAMLASSVRAGHSLAQALEQVAADSPEPTRGALAQVVREIGVGSAQDEALARLTRRFPSEDLDLITSAMDVQQQVGGSLSRVLDDIVATLRERVRIEGDIHALTAQQRYSAYVLALLPVFVAIGLFAVSGDYAQLLLTGVLRFAVAGAALMVLAGFLIMQKIASVDV